jgi:hypothetical protein
MGAREPRGWLVLNLCGIRQLVGRVKLVGNAQGIAHQQADQPTLDALAQ